MNYENGGEIFPEHLLYQIQKYISGKLVYIPIKEEKKAWGEVSGYKRYLLERNQKIREQFAAGADISSLSDEFFLSCETIKKIVYSKKEEISLKYDCSLSSALEYADAGKTEQWIHEYLLSDGQNKEFSDGLKLFDRYFLGPVKMPLSLFKRCCGPEEDMKYRIDSNGFENHVQELMDVIRTEKDMPPLIANFVEGRFELNDGNHRFEAYTRLGSKEQYIIIWITGKEDLELFKEKYRQYYQNNVRV